MRKVVIAGAARTPIGSYGGVFKGVSAVELGTTASKEAIKRANIRPDQIEEVVLGNVLSAGLGQNPARQVAVYAGVPIEVPAMTLNKVCGSGLRSVSLAAQMIQSGDVDIVLAGGMENMSQAPYVLDKARWGARMGDTHLVDAMIKDGLSDAFEKYHMGITAENIATEFNVSRAEQDAFALRSQTLAEAAQKSGRFDAEIVPVEIKDRKKGTLVVDQDEYIKYGMAPEKLEKLRPAFIKEGTVTAGNASGINDGAAAFVVMSEEKAVELGIEPIACIEAFASAGVDPSIMGYGPVPATRKALEKAGMEASDLELIEANEAFASQSIAVARALGLSMDIVNVNGGAIALGHPIGGSGARILVTLLYEMQKRDAKSGLATLCIGGGQGSAVIVSR